MNAHMSNQNQSINQKGHMRSKFKNEKFANLIADAESSQKVLNESVFLFLIFHLEHTQNYHKSDTNKRANLTQRRRLP